MIEKILSGDEDAAEELVSRYYPAILRYCRRHTQSPEKAEDLTQETFLKLFRSLPEYDGRKKFRSYLYTIASRLCVDESRKIRLLSLEEEALPGQESREMCQAEDRAALRPLLEKLPPELREAVYLRYGEQLTCREIAIIMGSNRRTVQSRIRRALKIMKGAWTET